MQWKKSETHGQTCVVEKVINALMVRHMQWKKTGACRHAKGKKGERVLMIRHSQWKETDVCRHAKKKLKKKANAPSYAPDMLSGKR